MNGNFITVLLVDDHQVLRDGLRVLIESEDDMQVIGDAESGDEAIEKLSSMQPDVIVLDLGMPGMSGLETIREIRRREVPSKIVVLSMHNDREAVTQAITAGSDGYVPKSTTHISLLEAIRVVHSGESYLHPSAASAVISELKDKQDREQLLEILSSREREVLRLIAMGHTSREIGEKLSLSPKTIDTYRRRAMNKLDLEGRSDVVRFALKSGLLNNKSAE